MADFTIKQGDTSPAIEATLKDNTGNVVNLTGASVRFHMATLGFSSKIDAAATIVNASEGKVKYEWQSADTVTADSFIVEWEITYSDSSVETFPNDGYTRIKIERKVS